MSVQLALRLVVVCLAVVFGCGVAPTTSPSVPPVACQRVEALDSWCADVTGLADSRGYSCPRELEITDGFFRPAAQGDLLSSVGWCSVTP